MPVRNLLFDLGGVIMDINKSLCAHAFRNLGFDNIDAFLGDYEQKGAFAALESGAITPSQFRAEVRGHIALPVSDARIDEAFEAFLIGIPRQRLVTLRALRSRYGIYLLSNTNPIMWDGFIARSFRQEGLAREDYFDGMLTSFTAKIMKPAPEIFEMCARNFDIDPAETVFFDDSQANCEAARRCGFRATHVPAGTEFSSLIPDR